MKSTDYKKLLGIVLEKIEQYETEVVLQKYEIQHLKGELEKQKNR